MKIKGLQNIADYLNMALGTISYHVRMGHIELSRKNTRYWAYSRNLDKWKVRYYERKHSGEKIKRTRQKRDISGSELARMLGVTPAAVYHWETERGKPNKENEKKLEKFLKLS